MKVEFYKDHTGTFKPAIYFKFEGSDFQEFDKLTPEEIESVFEHISKFDEAKKALLQLSRFFPGNKKQILKQFISCNWLELDDMIDITNTRLNYEFVPCPRRSAGTCEFGAAICMKNHF